jgi:hypothetical protein
MRYPVAAKALDAKTKELIALAIGVAVHCDDRIAFHVKACAFSLPPQSQAHSTPRKIPRLKRCPLHDRINCP